MKRSSNYLWHNVFERVYERRDVEIRGRVEEMADGRFHISVTVNGVTQPEDPEFCGPFGDEHGAKNACWKRIVRVSTAIPYK